MDDTTTHNDRGVSIPGRDRSPVTADGGSQEAAANVTRHQLEYIYSTNPPHQSAQPSLDDKNNDLPQTYNREHADASRFDWKKYHAAWQNYYQHYYHYYYTHALQSEHKQQLSEKAAAAVAPAIITGADQSTLETNKSQTSKVREELLEKVKDRARQARKSSHFWPIATALGVGLAFFLFQFNKVIAGQVSAFVSPSSAVTDNIITDPNASPSVGPEPRLVIPKINVDVPVVYGLTSLDNASAQKELEKGVIHYPIPGANNVPGETGNGVFLGHSSNEVFAGGGYKFVFVRLDALQPGDTFYMHYQGSRYIYRVSEKKVISPNQISELVRPTDKPMVTLITCVPIGTARDRLLVYADQISPDPAQAKKGSDTSSEDKKVDIPGQAPSFLEQLFGF